MNTEMIQREIELLARVLAAQMNSIAELEASLDREVTFNNKLTKKLGKRILKLEAAPKVKTLTAQVAALEAEVLRLRGALDSVQQVANRSDGIAGWPEAAHEHINDAIRIRISKDFGDFAPKYSVVPLIVKPGEEK